MGPSPVSTESPDLTGKPQHDSSSFGNFRRIAVAQAERGDIPVDRTLAKMALLLACLKYTGSEIVKFNLTNSTTLDGKAKVPAKNLHPQLQRLESAGLRIARNMQDGQT